LFISIVAGLQSEEIDFTGRISVCDLSIENSIFSLYYQVIQFRKQTSLAKYHLKYEEFIGRLRGHCRKS
jgi:hypothetical protein